VQLYVSQLQLEAIQIQLEVRQAQQVACKADRLLSGQIKVDPKCRNYIEGLQLYLASRYSSCLSDLEVFSTTLASHLALHLQAFANLAKRHCHVFELRYFKAFSFQFKRSAFMLRKFWRSACLLRWLSFEAV
jgi:hypothetical protein